MRRFVFVLLALCVCSAFAQDYPAHPITIVVPWKVGNPTDVTARALAPLLERNLGVAVQVLNRTGGSGSAGHQSIAQANPDGYLFGIINLEVTALDSNLPELNKFVPIAVLAANPMAIVVRNDAPWATAADFFADLKQNPGKYHSVGRPKGLFGLARAGFLKAIGASENALPVVAESVPGAALRDLADNKAQVALVSAAEAKGWVRSGELRYLAFMADHRCPSFGEVPTLKELGVEWSAASYMVAVAPQFTMPLVSKKIDGAVAKIVGDPEFMRSLSSAGLLLNYLDYNKTKVFMSEQNKMLAQLASK